MLPAAPVVVIPARDEAPRVGPVVRAVHAALPGARVIVVENGSRDDTAGRAAEAGAVVLHAAQGYARALRVGFDAALRDAAPVIVQMDADGQHSAAALPVLLEALTHADVVVGSRFAGEPAGYPVPAARRAAIAALGAWATVCAGQRLRDVTSGLRVWRADALTRVLPRWDDDVADANVLVAAVRLGLRVREVPVRMHAREGGRSQHEGFGAVRFVARMAALSAREALRRPLGSLLGPRAPTRACGA